MKIELIRLDDDTLAELNTLQLEGFEIDSELLNDLSYQLNNQE